MGTLYVNDVSLSTTRTYYYLRGTVGIVPETQTRVERAEDHRRLNQSIVVELAEIFDCTNSTLIVTA